MPQLRTGMCVTQELLHLVEPLDKQKHDAEKEMPGICFFAAMIPLGGWAASAGNFALKYGDEALAVARHSDDVPVVTKALGSRGVRNTADLTGAQIAQLRAYAGQVGLRGSDVIFVRGPSPDSDMTNQIWLGQDVLTAPVSQRVGGSVFERLSSRAVIAHEAGHLKTTRAGIDMPRGSGLLDEVQASLVGRRLPGLNRVERYQLLRDAAERARNEGTTLRSLLPMLAPMTTDNQKRIDSDALANLLVAAYEEYSQTGTSTMRCPACTGVIQFRPFNESILEVRCPCGLAKDVLKGL